MVFRGEINESEVLFESKAAVNLLLNSRPPQEMRSEVEDHLTSWIGLSEDVAHKEKFASLLAEVETQMYENEADAEQVMLRGLAVEGSYGG